MTKQEFKDALHFTGQVQTVTTGFEIRTPSAKIEGSLVMYPYDKSVDPGNVDVNGENEMYNPIDEISVEDENGEFLDPEEIIAEAYNEQFHKE